MNCQRCGHLLQTDEAFCGQCGMPSLMLATVGQGKQLFPSQSWGLSDEKRANMQQLAPHNSSRLLFPEQQEFPNRPEQASSTVQAHYETRHSIVSSGTARVVVYTASARSERGYQHSQESRPALTTKKQSRGAIVFIMVICSIISIISVTAFIASTLPKGNGVTPQVQTPIGVATGTRQQVNLTPGMRSASTSTPEPDASFTWCGTICASYGFMAEYPAGWQQAEATEGKGIQFSNPNQEDQVATISSLGTTTSSASDVLNQELQARFGNKTGYTAPSSTSTSTIGGETWVSAQISYLNDSQKDEQVAVFLTVHQGVAYLLAFQALDSDEQPFSTTYTTYYASMLNRFQFSE